MNEKHLRPNPSIQESQIRAQNAARDVFFLTSLAKTGKRFEDVPEKDRKA